MSERTPWRRMMALSMSLGVAPAAFWRLSVNEWRALAAPTQDRLTRGAFDALALRFPDEQR